MSERPLVWSADTPDRPGPTLSPRADDPPRRARGLVIHSGPPAPPQAVSHAVADDESPGTTAILQRLPTTDTTGSPAPKATGPITTR